MAGPQPRKFQTTRWSLVVAAGGTTNERSRRALDELCHLYWYPVYAFIRRSGNAPDAAHDLTQGFFLTLLERKDFGAADPDRGRFRSWLLGCVKHYLLNRHDFDTAQKRGGGLPLLGAEERYGREPADGGTPESLYLRRWVQTLLDEVLAQLRAEALDAARFDLLRPYLVDEGEASYAELGNQLGIKDNAVKQAVHALRLRFRDRLRTELAGTVASAADVDAELRHFFNELS